MKQRNYIFFTQKLLQKIEMILLSTKRSTNSVTCFISILSLAYATTISYYTDTSRPLLEPKALQDFVQSFAN